MVNVGIYIYTDSIADLSNVFVNDFISRVQTDSGTFEAGNCLLSELQNLGGSLGVALQAKRIELFSDEKISVTSSIQNINDIGKTYTDFSQTFTVPATKNNNKIFKHWYENSLDTQFSTLVKADAYIELDTIPFRSGKIQLESCDIKNGQPQSYSITFIGNLGNLKDKFAGKFLKDLDSTLYDILYTAEIVKNKIVGIGSNPNVMFPLISSDRYWNYDSAIDPTNNISNTLYPIRYNELFPAVRLQSIFNMIGNDFDVNLQGTIENPSAFLTDERFINAYLYLKNAESFTAKETLTKVNLTSESGDSSTLTGYTVNLTNDTIINTTAQSGIVVGSNPYIFTSKKITFNITPSVSGISYSIKINKNGILIFDSGFLNSTSGVVYTKEIENTSNRNATNDYFEIYVGTSGTFTFTTNTSAVSTYTHLSAFPIQQATKTRNFLSASQTTPSYTLQINQYMPEIKIEDFFSGVLKMFNLTCYSSDGINYTIDTIENYYATGDIIDLTKYIKSDSINLTRVKTHKKINFLYEKSESLVNVGFNSNAGIEYGSLYYENIPKSDGEEYSIKLPFEDLNFNNLKDKLQVGYCLKTDYQKYIPKPIILYDYNPTGLTPLTGADWWFNTNITGGTSTQHTSYKAFGQELLTGGITYSLNFPEQQSTLTNEVVANSLYQTYYSNYIGNIFNYRARLIKVSALLPISVLTSLKLNNRIIIRDKRYIINSFTTDLTTGEASFELLTDLRTL
jgi:hypothetical protein